MSTTCERFPLEPKKFTLVIVFLIIAALSNWISLAYIHDFIGRDAIPDIIFNLIDEQPWATPVGDFMVTLSSVSLILLFTFHKQRAVVIRRVLFIIGCLYTFRTIMMLVTQLPSGYRDNSHRCRPALNQENRTFYIYLLRTLEQTVHVGFQDNSKQMLCGDLLFSGHTLIMIVASLSINRYIDKSFQYLKWFPFLFALIGVPCMVISRTHYTCDVIIAFFASKAIFIFYHVFCEIESSNDRRRSILQTLFVIRIIAWLEENVSNHKLKNEFEIPFLSTFELYTTNRACDRRNENGSDKSMTNFSASSSTAAMEYA